MENGSNVSFGGAVSNEALTKCKKCSAENSGKALFCKNCGNQLVCKDCGTQFEEELNFCTSCGVAVVKRHQESTAVNQIEYTQKGNSKSLTGKFTDQVGGYFANAFNMVIAGHPIPTRNPFQKTLTLPSKSAMGTQANNKERFESIQDAELVSDDYAEIIARIFKESETGKLELIDNRLKEKSKNDKIKRLTVLFLYANKLHSNEGVTREDLNDLMKREKLSLKHFRVFMAKEALKYLSLKDNGTYSLLAAGDEYAQLILGQLIDSDYKPTLSKSGRKPGKKSSETGTGKENKNASSNPSALDMCKVLVKEEYFNQRRRVTDIVEHCSHKKAQKYSSQLLQYALTRLIKDQVLEREKNSEKQYEYWKK